MSPWTTVALCTLAVLALAVGRWLGSVASSVQFDRRCLIVNALRRGRRLTAIEICGLMDIPTGTIHPDLAALMRGGLVVREIDTVTPVDRFLYRLRTDEEASRD